MKIWAAAFLVLSAAAGAQQTPIMVWVPTAPSGACVAGLPLEVVSSTGVIYSCQGGTWAAAAGGTGSGTVGSGGSYALPAYGSATSTIVGASNIVTDATGNNLTVPGQTNFGTASGSLLRWSTPTTSASTTYGGSPYTMATGIVNYGGVNDNTLTWGYNVGAACSGSLVPDATKPQWCDQIEMDYQGTAEQHWNLLLPNGHIYRSMYWQHGITDETFGLVSFNIGTSPASGFRIATGQFGSDTQLLTESEHAFGATNSSFLNLGDPTGTYNAGMAMLANGELNIGATTNGVGITDIYISPDIAGTKSHHALQIGSSGVVLPLGALTLGTGTNAGAVTVNGSSGTNGNVDYGSNFGAPAIYLFHQTTNQYGLGILSGTYEAFSGTNAGFSWNTGGWQSTASTNQLMSLSSGGALAAKASVKTGPVAFASLTTCNSGAEGTSEAVTDSTTATWGATVTGGGANHILAYCDGTNWTVAAK